MQEASSRTVLGEFSNKDLTRDGETFRFFRRGTKFLVNARGADGRTQDFEVAYTFGVFPLQQYLVTFPGGRYQALPWAWDSRPAGQDWFYLYPGQKLGPRNPLHWTGIDQNWNYQCAECHSTNLQKRYDEAAHAYATTWAEINVACEACHGPGSRHVAWASKEKGTRRERTNDDGMSVHFEERQGVLWTMNPETGIAARSRPRSSSIEIDACARCHSRRGSLTEHYVPGRSLLDSHMPAFLTEGLYEADGQIEGEVYEYGSFLQSKMYAAGVTCSDCHDPHSGKTKASGGDVCASCHAPARFNTPTHHHHANRSRGADCLGCHMPEHVYMGVDARRDHSFRIPRPDLSLRFGTSNGCRGCHGDKDDAWAAKTFRDWYGPLREPRERYTTAFHAIRQGKPDAADSLIAAALDTRLPGIARGTALLELGQGDTPERWKAVLAGLRDSDALVRLGAVRALRDDDVLLHASEIRPLLSDSHRAIRVTAGAILAGTPPGMWARAETETLQSAISEYVDAQKMNAERPEAHLNLGLLEIRRGRFPEAENEYRTAISLEPSFGPGYVNLADLFRMQSRDAAAESTLRLGARLAPLDASVAHSLGLVLVREHTLNEALLWLASAAKMAPGSRRYVFVYGVALYSAGQKDEAIRVLETIAAHDPEAAALIQRIEMP